ncbi:MAG TPA: hypothetical protein PLG54_00680 [Bacteroidales bacterium]|jgi:hypothetical protein|nr:MAG: hypothetical protein BWX51_00724 [Bacteroidetes bacterium ADurb.Bin012]HNQ59156.1 hypothetical protein [Bacteroidales bacterium]HNV16478.1 hypothetical protein [Bacteroidales bacterium]HOE58262.1 hypothetical protein [Bacteroidales bacterium]HOR04018.1 hypothetical protein [Bacteroidales bacterium]
MKAQRMMKILGCGLLNLAFFAVPIITLAQPPQDNPDKWEQIKAQKIAYLSAKLELKPSESQKFWPVYNEYSEKRDKLLNEIYPKLSKQELDRLMMLSDKEAAQRMDEYFIKQTQLLDLEKKYNACFRKILPDSKVFRLYMAEMMFKKELLDDMRRSKHGPKEEY